MNRSENSAVTVVPVGVVHSPFRESEGTPVQPHFSSEKALGSIEIFESYGDGLKDLHEFSHILVLYHLHRVVDVKMVVTPFLDNAPHGIFATRSPARPNHIGLSLLPLLRIEGRKLYVSHLDILDETPVLDIKPFVPAFDSPQGHVSAGWFDRTDRTKGTVTDDGRFVSK